MTSEEKIQALSERIAPHLEEMGIGAFVLVGYVAEPQENGGEKFVRLVMHGSSGPTANVLEDGLRNMLQLADRWGHGQL